MKSKLTLYILCLSIAHSAYAAPSPEVEALRDQLGLLRESMTELKTTVEGQIAGHRARMETLRRENQTLIPVGTIMSVAGNIVLPDYLACNGQWLNRTEYKALYDRISLAYTPTIEQADHPDEFKLPDLQGRTLVGEKEGCTLGFCQGNETATLAAENMPPHSHSGTSEVASNGHTHTGRTGDDSPDHSHPYDRQSGGLPSDCYASHVGYSPNQNIATHSHKQYKTYGVSTKHQHPFTTDEQGANHTHKLTTTVTNPGGVTSQPFSVMNPSTTIRFLIKVK